MIITADDFGFTEDINKAIINLINDGLITQTSLMVNNQPGTKHAVDLIHKHNLKNVGLHFNITQGQSMSNPNITFSKEKVGSYSEEFIKQEFKTQIKFFKDNNIYLHHLDSHHNIHLKYKFIEDEMKLYDIPIRNNTVDGFDCDGNELNFICKLNNAIYEIGTHVALSTKDLYDTVLLENRIKEYEFFYKNSDIIKYFLSLGSD